MQTCVKKYILAVKPYQPGKPVDEVKREMGLRRVIKLASNESPFPPSPRVISAITRAAETVNRYPDGGCYHLRAALAKMLAVDPAQFIFGNGSDEVLVLAVRAFVNPGDEVVIATPSFLIYDIAPRLEGARLRRIPLKDFRYDLDGMQQAVNAKTRLVFIGNPDNPAGTFVTAAQLRKFMKQIPPHVLVVVDEAYYEFVRDADYPDSVSWLREFPNLLVTRTFSKMYGLAGLRVGYGIGSPGLIDVLNRVRDPFNVNTLAQAAALACLRDKAYYRRMAAAIEEQRRWLSGQIADLGLTCVRTVTNFMLIDVKQPATAVVQKLMARGVIVRDMTPWGLTQYIRVTIGTPKENIQFLKILRSICG